MALLWLAAPAPGLDAKKNEAKHVFPVPQRRMDDKLGRCKPGGAPRHGKEPGIVSPGQFSVTICGTRAHK
jgi:hypothetical protein